MIPRISTEQKLVLNNVKKEVMFGVHPTVGGMADGTNMSQNKIVLRPKF